MNYIFPRNLCEIPIWK